MSTRRIDSHSGPATLMIENTEPIHVECSFVVEEEMPWDAPPLIRWHGAFSTEAVLPAAAAARLALADGRCGDILVRERDVARGFGAFDGAGEPPR
jgi:hypothetical protein